MSTVRIGYEGDEPEGSVVAAAEIINAKLEVVARLPVLSGSGQSIPLGEPGSYLIRSWLPSGQRLTATFEATDKHETVILRAPEIPALPIAETEPPGKAARQDTWALIWALQDGQWAPMPSRVSDRGQDGASIEIPATSTGSVIVQVGGALPTLMTVIPATGSPAHISVQPDRQSDTSSWRWRVDVPADPGFALLRYLENGDLRSARILADVFMEKSPWPYETPLLAAAAGYVLLRFGDHDKLSALTGRYMHALDVLPDGAVIRAWMQLHEPEPDFGKVRNLLQGAAAQLPAASEGLRLLSRGLRILVRLQQDDALCTTLDRIGPLAAAIALQTDPLTAFSGREPMTPSVMPVATDAGDIEGTQQQVTRFQMLSVLRSTTGLVMRWTQNLTPAVASTVPRESLEPQVSATQIAVHWREEEYVYPPDAFVEQANANDPDIYDRFSEDNFPECFTEYAELLSWDKRWETILDASNPPFWRWFVGGKLNVSYNCVDRHLGRDQNKAALIWVPEPEDAPPVSVSYRELYRQVNEFAALLRDFCGLKAGDRVTLHLPMVPELPVTMLACARLGVIHSQVFAGFSGAACGGRIADSDSRILITMDGYYRSGDLLDHKSKADEAVEAARKEGQEVEKVLVWRRYPGQYSAKTEMVEGRDFFVDEVLADYRHVTVPPVPMPAEAPLFLMYTSGTTGRPKGCQHSTGGYLSYVAGTSKYYQDIHPEDTYWCMADIGWITGHSYIVYGPLALGTTSVLYEGTPNYPDVGRPWRIAQQLGVTIFHTSPTAIRMLRKVGPDEPAKYDYHFKHMTTVGEPIEPQVWRWYYNTVGKGEAVIVDTWWQTETGGFLSSTLPALEPMKPGSSGPAALGIYLQILDEDGDEVPAGRAGNICIRNPWPGIMQTIWGQPERFMSTYFAKYNRDPDSKDWRDWPYFAGDGAVQAEDGYFRILGRVDDVINVAGHRLGTKEIESAALTVPEVAEAAAVPVVDDVRGRVVEMYVCLKPGVEASPVIEAKVKEAIETDIGKVARPKHIWIVPDMPKTRSGEIMRRVIASVSNFADVGDITTLANPEVVDSIRHHVQGQKIEQGGVAARVDRS